MHTTRSKVLLSAGITVFIFAILSLVFWDFVRDTIALPLYYLIWVTELILKSIPQEIFLVGLIIMSLVVGVNTVHRIGINQTARQQAAKPQHTSARYVFWRRLHNHLYENQFSRGHFATESRKLILSILSYQEGLDSAQIEAMIVDGSLDVPDTVRKLILDKAIRTSRPIPGAVDRTVQRLRQLFFKVDPPTDPQIDQQIEDIVGFIEHRLEITHVGNQRES